MKNVVLVAPLFPYTFYQFAIGFKQLGWRVLAIGDVHESLISPELSQHIDAYYYVADMNHYPHMKEAIAYFIHRFGTIDWIESNNEHWLKTDAQLREDFSIKEGLRPKQLSLYQSKLSMKTFYEQAHIPVARYQEVSTREQATAFASEVGYPLFVKPDVGVGSSVSIKLKEASDLVRFFETKPAIKFILEEFIEGDIYSFDGMTNSKGEVVFYTAHFFPINIAAIVNGTAESYFVTLKDIPTELVKIGLASVQAFSLKKRFFHFEFFRLRKTYPHLGKQGDFIALEANMRPPGGFMLEMINYANQLNAYHLYTHVVDHDDWSKQFHRAYVVAFASRKHHHRYAHPSDWIRQKYQNHIVFENQHPYPISIAMGDYFFLARFPTMDEATHFFDDVYAK